MSKTYSVQISEALNRAIEEAREGTGRTKREEVEMRMRISLTVLPSHGFIAMRVDEGLMACLQGMAGCGFYGPINDACIYLLRKGIIEMMGSENLRREIMDNMPPEFRSRMNHPRK